MPEREEVARKTWATLIAGNYDDVQQKAVEADFIPTRRVQFYSDEGVRLSDDLIGIIKEVLGSVPRGGFKALQVFVPVWPPEDLIKHPVLELIEALNGRVNVAFSDAVFSLSTKEPVVFDTVTLDFDIKDGLTLDEARQLAGEVNQRSRRELGVEPLLIYTGCKGIHIKYFLQEALPIDLLKPLKSGVYAIMGLRDFGLRIDERTLDAKHVFKPPFVINTKCGGLSVPINEVDVESHMLDPPLARGLARIGRLLTLERGATPKAPATAGVGGGNNSNTVVEAWRRLVNTMLDAGFKLYDCRHRFSCLLGRYCVQSGISLDECLALLDKLVVDGSSTAYVNRLRYCYNHVDKAEYLPSPTSFLNKDEWYACGNDVTELREIVEKALARGKKQIKNTH
jgi:hypothetical protein